MSKRRSLFNDPAADAITYGLLIVLAAILAFAGVIILVPLIVVSVVIWKLVSASRRHAAPAIQSPPVLQPVDEFAKATLSRFLTNLNDRGGDMPCYPLVVALDATVRAIYNAELHRIPLYPPSEPLDPQRIQELLNAAVLEFLLAFVDRLPAAAQQSPQRFYDIADAHAEGTLESEAVTVPVLDLVENAGAMVLAVCFPFYSDEIERFDLFRELRYQLDKNLHDLSGIPFTPLSRNTGNLTMPYDFEGTPQELAKAYLRGTALAHPFAEDIAFGIPEAIRFEHTHVVAGSGHGKTQLLQHIIFNDIQRSNPPALIVIDSQGEMLQNIQRLALFDPEGEDSLSRRLIIIDAEDVEYPPALNMFSIPSDRLKGYSSVNREQIESGTIELFNYIFGALAAELTQKQGTAFAYVTRLMLSIPGATIHTLRELMEDGSASLVQSPFAEQILALDPTSRAFFENQFFNRGAFAQTKQQIARRLYGVLQVPAFDRMFSTKLNKLDMFTAMQSGSIVLVNTSKTLLKSDASALFGRYMIALALHAAFERVAIPEQQRRPAFLIVDEAAEYFDETLDALLSQARKFKLGVLFAHQHLDQLTPSLRSSVAANTSIKLAGGVSDRDARALAPDMRTNSEFLANMRKHPRSTEFACYIRNYIPGAIRLTIPFLTIENAPRMPDQQHAVLLSENRARYAASRKQPRPVATSPGVSPPDAPETDEWRS